MAEQTGTRIGADKYRELFESRTYLQTHITLNILNQFCVEYKNWNRHELFSNMRVHGKFGIIIRQANNSVVHNLVPHTDHSASRRMHEHDQ